MASAAAGRLVYMAVELFVNIDALMAARVRLVSGSLE